MYSVVSGPVLWFSGRADFLFGFSAPSSLRRRGRPLFLSLSREGSSMLAVRFAVAGKPTWPGALDIGKGLWFIDA